MNYDTVFVGKRVSRRKKVSVRFRPERLYVSASLDIYQQQYTDKNIRDAHMSDSSSSKQPKLVPLRMSKRKAAPKKGRSQLEFVYIRNRDNNNNGGGQGTKAAAIVADKGTTAAKKKTKATTASPPPRRRSKRSKKVKGAADAEEDEEEGEEAVLNPTSDSEGPDYQPGEDEDDEDDERIINVDENDDDIEDSSSSDSDATSSSNKAGSEGGGEGGGGGGTGMLQQLRGEQHRGGTIESIPTAAEMQLLAQERNKKAVKLNTERIKGDILNGISRAALKGFMRSAHIVQNIKIDVDELMQCLSRLRTEKGYDVIMARENDPRLTVIVDWCLMERSLFQRLAVAVSSAEGALPTYQKLNEVFITQMDKNGQVFLHR